MTLSTKLDLLRDLDPLSAHIVASRRGKAGEINKNRQDLQEFVERFVGDAVRPEILYSDVALADLAGPITAVIAGRDFLPPGWKKSSVVVDTGVANTALLWTSVLPGVPSNLLQIEYVAGAGALSVAVLGNIVTVTLAAGGSTAAAVAAAVAAHATAKYMMVATNYGGSTGLGTIVAAVAATNLTGGEGRKLVTAGYQTALGGADNDLLYRSRIPGAKGLGISIEYVDTGAVTPVVTVAGSAVSVAINAGVTTAAEVLAALWASDTAKYLFDVSLAPGNDGTGTVAALAATNLVNFETVWYGYFIPTVGGAASFVAEILDDQMTVDLAAAPAAAAAGAVCQVVIPLCGNDVRILATVV